MSSVRDKYDVIKILGEGSFGKCYLMRDRQKRIQVCVKVIKIRNMPQKERVATQMEVDLLRRLCHPNIVRYYDSFMSKNGESLCISMEYCDGGDLAGQIKNARRQLFSEEKILHWFVQMGLGLHYMHTNKVLHRDLKTQNVFLLGNGRLVLGDLGISKVLDGTMDFAQTCIGTPYYMSPEIFKNKPYVFCSMFFLVCDVSPCLSLIHLLLPACLLSLAPHDTSLTTIPLPQSIINRQYSHHLLQYRYSYKSDVWALGCVL
jgi:non-specific serine/threonine protein kinase/NIMA (never in mitosis gene a)-related kinase